MTTKKLHCLLDIDMTLISAEPTEEFDFKKNKKKSEKFSTENMEDYYIVFERPGLQEFLDYVFKNFYVSVFTAASCAYALFIVEKIILKDKSRKLEYIFFDYHCRISEHKYDAQKSLRLFWEEFRLPTFNPGNTFLIDDYCHNKETQPCNCIQVKEFSFYKKGSENDDELAKLIPKLENLKQEAEVSVVPTESEYKKCWKSGGKNKCEFCVLFPMTVKKE
jgi:TFIIF-interacting CTD phosphatase-like protein